jgi:hypothetical protein
VLFPWSGLGLRYLLAWLTDRAGLLGKKYPRTTVVTRRIPILFLSLWLLGAITYSLAPYRQDDRYHRDAGEYIAGEFGTNTSMLAHIADTRVSFYAESDPEYYSSLESLETFIEGGDEYDFVLWDTKTGPKPDNLDRLLAERGFLPLATFTGTDDDTIYIYRNEAVPLSPPQ